MGASGWSYFTPYRPDIRIALDELRQRVFTNKEYGDPAQAMAMADPEALVANLPAEQRKQTLAALAQLKAYRAAQREPRTTDELLEQTAEEGTHSIIDISQGLSDGPDFGTAFPMPDDVKLDLYGTMKPSHEQVAAKSHERGEDLERWQCWYVVVYKGQQPDEVYFEGCSGD